MKALWWSASVDSSVHQWGITKNDPFSILITNTLMYPACKWSASPAGLERKHVTPVCLLSLFEPSLIVMLERVNGNRTGLLCWGCSTLKCPLESARDQRCWWLCERFSLLSWIQVALGTVTNVEEAVKWLSYTYLYVRMRANPLAYGINHKAYQVGDVRVSSLLFCLSVQDHSRTFSKWWSF